MLDLLIEGQEVEQCPGADDLALVDLVEKNVVFVFDVFGRFGQDAVVVGPFLSWLLVELLFRRAEGHRLVEARNSFNLSVSSERGLACPLLGQRLVVNFAGLKELGGGLYFVAAVNARGVLFFDVLVNRLQTPVSHEVASVGLHALRHDNFAKFVVLDFADTRKHDQRVRRQLLEVGCLPEEQYFEHKFQPHLREDSLNEVLFWDADCVDIVAGCLQVILVFAEELHHVEELPLNRCVAENLARSVSGSDHRRLRFRLEHHIVYLAFKHNVDVLGLIHIVFNQSIGFLKVDQLTRLVYYKPDVLVNDREEPEVLYKSLVKFFQSRGQQVLHVVQFE